MITDKRMSAARVVELRACHNPVFDELLDFVQEMSNEYQKWICELEGPTPAELLEKIKTLELDLHAAIVREREAERRADAADTIVLPVEDGEPGEIDVLSDGHSHHYVPKSSYMELHAGFDIQSECLNKIAKYVGATDYVDSIGQILDAIDKKLEDAPFPLALSCPRCHQQHVDEDEWATKPHRQHQCVAGVFGPGCGARWTPSEHPTVGVMRSFQLDDMEHTPGRGQR